jgi:uncharacterized membrane protein
MTLLAAGLVLFLGIHCIPMLRPVRNRLALAWGEPRYKTLFSIVSAVGLVAIIAGWWEAGPGRPLFAPSPLAIAVAPYAMTLAFILLATLHSPSHLRAAVRHPMLLGVIVWSFVHLLANGDTRSTLLFGAVLAFALIDLASAVARHASATFEPRLRADVISVVAGTAMALLVMAFHRVLFGHAVVPFSV